MGNHVAQSYGTKALGERKRRSYVRRAAKKQTVSKPRETLGRKANWGLSILCGI